MRRHPARFSAGLRKPRAGCAVLRMLPWLHIAEVPYGTIFEALGTPPARPGGSGCRRPQTTAPDRKTGRRRAARSPSPRRSGFAQTGSTPGRAGADGIVLPAYQGGGTDRLFVVRIGRGRGGRPVAESAREPAPRPGGRLGTGVELEGRLAAEPRRCHADGPSRMARFLVYSALSGYRLAR